MELKVQSNSSVVGKVESFSLFLNELETYKWANRPYNKWPLSQISNHSLMVEFDQNGLVDLKIDNEYKDNDLSNNELNAIIWDHLPLYVKQDFQYFFPNCTVLDI